MKSRIVLLAWLLTVSVLTLGIAPESAQAFPRTGLYNNANGSPLINLIDTSQTSIHIEIYTMTSNLVLSALRRAKGRGVQIRIIQEPDPVSGGCDLFSDSTSIASADCANMRSLVQEIRAVPGNAYIPYNKDAFCGSAPSASACHQHGKLLIADGKIALISSGNFDDSSLCNVTPGGKNRCDRDYSALIDVPSTVATLEEIFARDLAGNSYDLTEVLSRSDHYLTVSPLSLQPLLDFINSAQASILVENQYLKDPRINTALMDQARKGLRVGVVVASPCAFGRPNQALIREFTAVYSAFDSVGIRARMFPAQALIDGQPGYMHAKAIVVDGKRAWMGSVNGSNSALTINREFGLFFDNPQWVSGLLQPMAEDFKNPATESWQDSLRCLKDYE